MKKQRYYVVWKGRKRGVFSSWTECAKQVTGFAGAKYKSFGTLTEATTAYKRKYEEYKGREASPRKREWVGSGPKIPSVSVDAACSGAPGRLEYRGVNTETGRVLFRAGPYAEGTNNVGEFLAIVEAVKWLKGHHLNWPIYSDSENAMAWFRARRCNTRLARTGRNRRLFEAITAAERELDPTKPYAGDEGSQRDPKVLKWNTASWGENPADFGRK